MEPCTLRACLVGRLYNSNYIDGCKLTGHPSNLAWWMQADENATHRTLYSLLLVIKRLGIFLNCSFIQPMSPHHNLEPWCVLWPTARDEGTLTDGGSQALWNGEKEHAEGTQMTRWRWSETNSLVNGTYLPFCPFLIPDSGHRVKLERWLCNGMSFLTVLRPRCTKFNKQYLFFMTSRQNLYWSLETPPGPLLEKKRECTPRFTPLEGLTKISFG